MKTNYTATIIGLFIAVLFFASQFEFLLSLSIVMSFASLFPSLFIIELPLENLFGSDDFFSVALTTMIIEVIILSLMCYSYFRKLVKAKRGNQPFNFGKLIIFLFFLQFVIHPIGFNMWAITNVEQSNDSMFIFKIVETVQYSGLAFVFIGALIDIIRYQKNKNDIITE